VIIIGCGYIGRLLGRKLVADGAAVTGVVRSWCRVQGAPMAAGLYRGVRVSWPAGGAA